MTGRLLLLSNSTNPGGRFLGHVRAPIRGFLGTDVRRVLFTPFAAVRKTYDAFRDAVAKRFESFGYQVASLHDAADPGRAVANAEALVVGGGNTFHLLREVQSRGVLDAIRRRVRAGAPYIGWSAGSNLACPTIRTTNDMPIVEPESFDALDLVPFQINPHYTSARPPRHGGETRDDRLVEFITANPDRWVIGLREGSLLRVEGGSVILEGPLTARVFRHGREPTDVSPGESLQFLLD